MNKKQSSNGKPLEEQYGAWELKRIYQRYLGLGLVGSVVIVFALTLGFNYYISRGGTSVGLFDEGIVYRDTIIINLPPIEEEPIPPPPSVSFDKPKAQEVITEIPIDFVMGTPEAVPEPEIEKPPEILTQEQLSAIADMFTESEEVLIKSSYLRIELLSPNGGEEWEVGSNHTIDWKIVSGSQVDSISIRYSTNNGATWEYIPSSGEEMSSHRWQVPDTPSRRCKVKVTAYAEKRIDSDESDRDFSIREKREWVIEPVRALKPKEVPPEYRSIIWISLRCCVNRLSVDAQTGNLRGREDIKIERIYSEGSNNIISMSIAFNGRTERLQVIPERAVSPSGEFVIWPYTAETKEERFRTLAGLTRILCEVLECNYAGTNP
jgi:hypothetical protein